MKNILILLGVSTVATVCLFGFLASVWIDMHQESVTLYLDEIVVTPEDY